MGLESNPAGDCESQNEGREWRNAEQK